MVRSFCSPAAATAVAGFLSVNLALTACSKSTTSSRRDTTSPRSASFRPIDQLTLDATIAKVATPLRTPGAVVLLRTPDGTLTSAYGTRSIGGGTPVTVDDHFRIGSNTKTFTTTAILQLAKEGKLSLDDAVAKYRPNVPGGDRITIAQLLAMRSGLPNYSQTLDLNATLDKEPTRAWKQEDLLALAFANPIEAAPGKEYFYTNTNTVLLGMIAEQLEAKSLSRIFQERFFTPYALKGTSFPAITSNAIPEPHPRGYMYGSNVETMQPLSAARQAAAAAGSFLPDDVTDENPSWGWSAGAGISTVRDLARWAELLGGGEVLGPQWHRIRLDSIVPTAPDNPNAPGYGYGIARLGRFLGHTGELPGFNSFMGHDPDARVTLIVWTNLNAAPDTTSTPPAVAIARALMGLMYGSADGASAPSGDSSSAR